MARRQPKPTRPQQFQGRTDAPGFASRIRSPQQPAAAAAALTSMFAPAAVMARRPNMKRGRGGRGR
jgi:hypothetical protein